MPPVALACGHAVKQWPTDDEVDGDRASRSRPRGPPPSEELRRRPNTLKNRASRAAAPIRGITPYVATEKEVTDQGLCRT